MINIFTLFRVKIEDVNTTVQFTLVALTVTSFQMTTELSDRKCTNTKSYSSEEMSKHHQYCNVFLT